MRVTLLGSWYGPRPGGRVFALGCLVAVGGGFLLLGSAAGGDAQPMGPSPDLMFAGVWRVVDAAAAPWTPPHRLTKAETPLLPSQIAFEASRVRGPSPVGCAHATYGTVLIPPKGLFQGSLPSGRESALARSLGLGPPEAPTLRVDCDTGTFDYHLDSKGRLVFVLDDVIYTMTRPSGKRGPA